MGELIQTTSHVLMVADHDDGLVKQRSQDNPTWVLTRKIEPRQNGKTRSQKLGEVQPEVWSPPNFRISLHQEQPRDASCLVSGLEQQIRRFETAGVMRGCHHPAHPQPVSGFQSSNLRKTPL
jgi:hypothetical protein